MQEEELQNRIEDLLTRLRALREGTTTPSDDALAEQNVLEELTATLEELQIAHEELHSQNEELSATQSRLDQQRSRLQELFEFAPDGYLVTDDEGVISAVNRSAAMLLHVPRQHLAGKPLIVYVVEEDRQAFHSRLTQVRNGHHIRNWRVRLQPRYDTPIITAVAATPADTGTRTHIRWLFRDITEQARAEEETKKHRDRLAGILNSAMDAVISHDEHQRITLFNPAAERIFQYDAAQVLGQPLDLLMPERFREQHFQHVQTFGRTEVTSRSMGDVGRVYGRRADGEEFPIEASISQIESGGEKFYTVILRDISQRVESEERLRRRTRELETLAQVSAAMRRAESSDELVPLLIARTVDALNADAGAVVIRREEDFVSFSLGESDSEDELCRQEHPPESMLLWHALPPEEPLFVSNVSAHDQLGQCAAWQAELAEMAAGAAVALPGEAETIALLMVGFRIGTEFSTDKRRLLSAIADIAGNALQRMNLMNTLERRVADRTRELSALYEVTSLASQSLDLSTVLEQSLQGVMSALDAEMGGIHLQSEIEEDHLRLVCHQGVPSRYLEQYNDLSYDHNLSFRVVEQNKPLLIPDLSADPRIPEFAQLPRTFVGVPMHAGGKTLGVLSVVGAEHRQFRAEEVALLSAIGDQVAIAVENARLHRQAQETAVSEERQRMARELHDSVTQHLYGMRLYSDAARELAQAGDLDGVRGMLSQLDDTLDEAFLEMRLLVHELRPSALEGRSLAEAVRYRLSFVEKRVGLKTDVQIDDVDDLPSTLDRLLYRVAQEALTNVIKHADAHTVSVRMWTAGDEVELQIEDDGVGFSIDRVQREGGMGLSGMRERVLDAGGTLEIDSVPGAGTTITARVPLVNKTR